MYPQSPYQQAHPQAASWEGQPLMGVQTPTRQSQPTALAPVQEAAKPVRADDYKASSYAEEFESKREESYSAAAIAGFVVAVAAIATSFVPIVNNASFFVGLAAIVLSISGIVLTAKRRKGMGFAVSGLLIGLASLAIVLFTQSVYSSAIDSAMDSLKEGAKPVEASSQASAADAGDKSNTASVSQGSKSAKGKQEGKVVASGKSYTLDNGLVITVNNAKTETIAYSDKKVKRINVTYENVGDSNVSFGPGDWKAEDSKGALRDFTFYGDSEGLLDYGDLRPGGTVTGDVCFDVEDLVKVYYYSNPLMQDESEVVWVF